MVGITFSTQYINCIHVLHEILKLKKNVTHLSMQGVRAEVSATLASFISPHPDQPARGVNSYCTEVGSAYLQ